MKPRQLICVPHPLHACIILFVLIAASGCTSSPPPTYYASPEQAVQSLIGALRLPVGDSIKQVVGGDSAPILASGDPISDREEVETFIRAYDEKHQITRNEDGSATLLVGEGDWPFPVPMMHAKNGWYFDVARGREEILDRRIGRNEEHAMEVCLAIADAQREFAMADPDGNGLPDYAQKLMSDPGSRNGLYWDVPEGADPSPLGPLVAAAAEEGYTQRSPEATEPRPYHGYRYRLLRSQSEHARGGAMDYMVGDKLIGGFAVVAYPAQYRSSGVMTFIVNADGIVFERDLGSKTASAAKSMTSFDPGPGWAKRE